MPVQLCQAVLTLFLHLIHASAPTSGPLGYQLLIQTRKYMGLACNGLRQQKMVQEKLIYHYWLLVHISVSTAGFRASIGREDIDNFWFCVNNEMLTSNSLIIFEFTTKQYWFWDCFSVLWGRNTYVHWLVFLSVDKHWGVWRHGFVMNLRLCHQVGALEAPSQSPATVRSTPHPPLKFLGQRWE